jgi:hypothetical protein
MRILLDECVPRRLRRELPGHDVRTVPEMGWSGARNGALLALMVAQGFEVFPLYLIVVITNDVSEIVDLVVKMEPARRKLALKLFRLNRELMEITKNWPADAVNTCQEVAAGPPSAGCRISRLGDGSPQLQ